MNVITEVWEGPDEESLMHGPAAVSVSTLITLWMRPLYTETLRVEAQWSHSGESRVASHHCLNILAQDLPCYWFDLLPQWKDVKYKVLHLRTMWFPPHGYWWCINLHVCPSHRLASGQVWQLMELAEEGEARIGFKWIPSFCLFDSIEQNNTPQ